MAISSRALGACPYPCYFQQRYGQAPNGPTGQEPWNLPPQNEVNVTPKDDPWDN